MLGLMVGWLLSTVNNSLNDAHEKINVSAEMLYYTHNSVYSCDSLSLSIKMTLIYYAFLKQ